MHSLNLNTNKVYIGQTKSTILPLINKTTYILFNISPQTHNAAATSIESLPTRKQK